MRIVFKEMSSLRRAKAQVCLRVWRGWKLENLENLGEKFTGLSEILT
jgi:hypothetical protein